jgi:hypothetical protein
MNFLDDWINYLLRHRTPPSCLWEYKSLEKATRNHSVPETHVAVPSDWQYAYNSTSAGGLLGSRPRRQYARRPVTHWQGELPARGFQWQDDRSHRCHEVIALAVKIPPCSCDLLTQDRLRRCLRICSKKGLPTFGKSQPVPNSATRRLDLSGELTAGFFVSRIASVQNRTTHRDRECNAVCVFDGRHPASER